MPAEPLAAGVPEPVSHTHFYEYLGDYLVHWANTGLAGQKPAPAPDPARDARLRALGQALCEALEQGSVCIDLNRQPSPADWPAAKVLLTELDALGLLAAGDQLNAPLAHRGTLLYLSRYLGYEITIAGLIQKLAAADQPFHPEQTALFQTRLQSEFPDANNDTGSPNWQRQAAATALLKPLTILTGHPGTGKTTTLCRLLRIMREAAPDLRIALAAPSGKAAARMSSAMKAVHHAADPFPPETGKTLHRLLRYSPTQDRFRHGPEQPLPFDVVVVDEASMVDMYLFVTLLSALGPGARLILCGDVNQLHAVAPGSLLSDLCIGPNGQRAAKLTSPALAQARAALTGFAEQPAGKNSPPVTDAVCELQRTYRFGSAIQELAQAILAGDQAAVMTVLGRQNEAIHFMDSADIDQVTTLVLRHELTRCREALRAHAEPAALLDSLGAFQALSATRVGEMGSLRLNQRIEAALRTALRTAHSSGRYFAGYKIIITRNDYRLGLFNGDIGLLLADDSGTMQAYFADAQEAPPRRIPLAKLGAFEPAFALTVHKCQGSEFKEVALLLPEPDEHTNHPISRHLLYTGITRAQQKVCLAASEHAIAATISRKARRHSGLGEKLWAMRD